MGTQKKEWPDNLFKSAPHSKIHPSIFLATSFLHGQGLIYPLSTYIAFIDPHSVIDIALEVGIGPCMDETH